jgi:hypothetical protein
MTDRNKTADAHQFLLRLPKPLHRRLAAQAKRNNVSLNTEIVNQLEGYETDTIRRATEIMHPLLTEAVHAAAGVALLLGIARPRTEEQLMGILRRIDTSDVVASEVVAAFRKREAAKGREGFMEAPEEPKKK